MNTYRVELTEEQINALGTAVEIAGDAADGDPHREEIVAHMWEARDALTRALRGE